MDPRLFGRSELCIFFGGVVIVGLKPSDLVHLSLVWGSACAWASAANSAATSMSTTTYSSGVTAPAATLSCTAKLGNAVHVGRVLLKVADKVGKQCRTFCEGLVIFPHGQHLADHGLDRIVLDSSQQMADLGVLVKATVTVLHQILGNGALLNVSIGIMGPIPVLLLAAIGQVCKAGLHLVGQMIHAITAKVIGKQEAVQLAAVLLLLGQGGMKSRGCLPKHFKQDVPYCHHVDAEGVAEGSILFQECDGFCRLAW